MRRLLLALALTCWASPVAAQLVVPGQTTYEHDGIAIGPYISANCPASGSYVAGSIVPTSDGTICYAPSGGSPPAWVEVGSTIGAAALTSTAPATGWMDGADVEARLDDGSADLATVSAAAASSQSTADNHIADTANPHDVTGDQVQLTDAGGYYGTGTTEAALQDAGAHAASTSNPHGTSLATYSVDATEAELDQVCDGVGPTVTAANLSTLTDTSDASALHDHSSVDGRDPSVDGSKLDGVEALADVTDSANVDAAGAVMEADYTAAGDVLVGDGVSSTTVVTLGTNTILGDDGTGVEALGAGELRALLGVDGKRHGSPVVTTAVAAGDVDCTTPYRDTTQSAAVVQCTGNSDNQQAEVAWCHTLPAWASAWDATTAVSFNYMLSDGTGNNIVTLRIYDGDDGGTACYTEGTGGTSTSAATRTADATDLSACSLSAGEVCVTALVTLDSADTVDLWTYYTDVE